MTDYIAPHDVIDPEKVVDMVRALRRGDPLPPIIVQGCRAFSGTHRLAAWAAVGAAPSVIEIDEDEYDYACLYLGLDPVYDEVTDFEPFVEALRTTGAYLGDAV